MAAGDEKNRGKSQEELSASGLSGDISMDDPVELARLLEEKTQEAESYYDRLLRLQADYENYKKRTQKEKAEQAKYANENLITKLFVVLDDLDRAMASARNDGADGRILEGIELIWDKLRDILDKAGLEEIATVGQEFDPNYHEAVMTAPAKENEDNMIVEELQKGYTLSGKVIRPAKVVVAIRGEGKGGG
jgi:molecular chaperone GrpE